VRSFTKRDRDVHRRRVGAEEAEEAARQRGAIVAAQWGYQPPKIPAEAAA
jgi:hypothetical protein